jgi:hypothetical protein
VDAERNRKKEQAWMEAAKRRNAHSAHWPNDPWRGGFGPSVNMAQAGIVELETVRELVGAPQRRTGGREVGEWLRGNGLIGR